MPLQIVAGMSGSGKLTAMSILEDSGYYCVYNLPPRFLVSFADIYGLSGSEPSNKIATVIELRTKEDFVEFYNAMEEMRKKDYPYQLIFLEADRDILLNRYKETRRIHPLMEDGITLEEAILEEKHFLENIREIADYVINTSKLLPAQLRRRLIPLLDNEGDISGIFVQVLSFGYKNGIPAEADFVFDVRGLRNPFYVPQLREYDGTNECIRDYVMEDESSHIYLKKLMEFVDFILPLSIKEGKSQLVIAFGCTGGKHRSVAFAEMLKEHLSEKSYRVSVEHRDKDKGLHGVKRF